jgi:hypothetical protein
MSTSVMGAFDEVYTNPQRCGYGTQSCLRNKDKKDNVNAGNTLIYGCWITERGGESVMRNFTTFNHNIYSLTLSTMFNSLSSMYHI